MSLQNVCRKWQGKIFKFKVFTGKFLLQVLIINPQAEGYYSSPQPVFFLNLFIPSRNGGEKVWRRKKKINCFLNIWHNRNNKINIKMIALKKLATKKYQSPLPFQNDPPLNHTFTPFCNISDSLPLSRAHKIHSPTYKKEGPNQEGQIKKIF